MTHISILLNKISNIIEKQKIKKEKKLTFSVAGGRGWRRRRGGPALSSGQRPEQRWQGQSSGQRPAFRARAEREGSRGGVVSGQELGKEAGGEDGWPQWRGRWRRRCRDGSGLWGGGWVELGCSGMDLGGGVDLGRWWLAAAAVLGREFGEGGG